MAEINLQKNLINSSEDDIIYVDQQSNSIYKCPVCHRIFRDPIITHCGVSYLFYRKIYNLFFLAYILSEMYFYSK